MMHYLSHQGKQLGPWSHEEIVEKLKTNELAWTDYIYDSLSKEWLLLMDCQQFAEVFKSTIDFSTSENNQKKQEPQPTEVTLNKETEWFVLKGENKYGPFNFVEMLKMLQEKALYEYDFVWNADLSDWKKVSEVEEFGADRIKSLYGSQNQDVKEAFYRRRYVRVSYNASLLVHNSKAVWKGCGIEIGPGGAGILMEDAQFESGQTLFLHFKAGDGVPPFNAICTVVSKQPAGESGQAIRYGVKFTSISHSVQRAIKAYTDSQAA